MANNDSQLLDDFNYFAKKARENFHNFQQKCEKTKSKVRRFEPIVNKYIDVFDDYVQFFAEKSTQPENDSIFFKNLFETYLPVSFYLLISSIMSFLFGQMVGWFLCFILTRFSAALISSLIIPHLIINYIPNVKRSEKDRRLLMLFATIVESLVMDFVWPGYRLRFVSPPMFLFCLGSMFFFHSKAHGRPNATFLVVIIGVPVYFYIFIYARLVTSTFGRLYHIWLFVIGGAAVMDIKAKMTQFLRGQTATVYHQGVSIAIIHSVAFFLSYISSWIVE